jgi:hypothetical protein
MRMTKHPPTWRMLESRRVASGAEIKDITCMREQIITMCKRTSSFVSASSSKWWKPAAAGKQVTFERTAHCLTWEHGIGSALLPT